MAQDAPFGCSCGAVSGTLRNLSKSSGGHVRCYCEDCRRAALWIGEDDSAPGGIHYYQTTPDRVEFNRGLETLKVMAWKKGRLRRWYAPCCGVAMFNTLDNPKWPFASINAARLENPEVLGSPTAFAFKPTETGKSKNGGMMPFIFGFIRRTLRARVSGAWRKTPFFKDNGAPIVEVQHLTQQDRAKVAP